jgi:hypothetical protein
MLFVDRFMLLLSPPKQVSASHQVNIYSLLPYLVLGNKPQGENRLLAGCKGAGLCNCALLSSYGRLSSSFVHLFLISSSEFWRALKAIVKYFVDSEN